MKCSLVTSSVLAIALAVSAAGIAQSETLKLSHVRPQDTAVDKDARWFADAVKEATGGEIEVKIYPASSLGDYTVVQERISVGAVDMAVQPPATAADKRFQIVYMPFMATGWEDAKSVYAPGSPLRNTIDGLYAKQDIRVLAAWPVYFGGISLNKEPDNPGDPDAAKGLKVRVPPIKSFQLLADTIGYIGSPLPFSEAFTAVQTGVVDGVIGSGAEGYYASFRDVTKYYLPINTHFEVWYLIINEGIFQDLDEEQQQQLLDVARQFEERRWQAAEEQQAADEQRLAEFGATIVALSPEQIEATAEKVRAAVWPEVLDDIGKDWGQNVLDQMSTQ